MNEHLMEALLYAALFFETSSDEECDPDLAMKRLEEISSSLQKMSWAEQDEFRVYARRVADRHTNLAVADEIRSLVGGGLLPNDDD